MLSDAGLDVDHWEIDLERAGRRPVVPGGRGGAEPAFGLAAVTAGGEATPGAGAAGPPRRRTAGRPGHLGRHRPVLRGDAPRLGCYGRGACDMKAGFAANLAVGRTLRAAGVRLERPLAVHARDRRGGRRPRRLRDAAPGHRGEAAVITEPTGGPAGGRQRRRAHLPDRGARPLRARQHAAARGSERVRGVPAGAPRRCSALEADRNARRRTRCSASGRCPTRSRSAR